MAKGCLLFNHIDLFAFKAHFVALTDGLCCCCFLQMEFKAVPIDECFVAIIAFGLCSIGFAALCMYGPNLFDQKSFKIINQ
jgi:hypothetical protein